MKKNRIILLVALGMLIIAAFLVLNNSSSTLKKKVSDFSVKDTASITKLFIADKQNKTVTLTRTPRGTWLVDGKNPAQEMKVNSFLKTLADLEVRAPVPLVARNNVIKRMSVLAHKIEIYQVVPRIDIFGLKLFPHEKNTKTYFVGDVTQDNEGTFMLMEGAEEPYIVFIPGFRGFVSSRYSTDPEEWRDYTVFREKLGDIASVKMEYPPDPSQSYLLAVSPDQQITITGLQNNQVYQDFDTIRVLNFLTAFNDIRFESLLNDKLPKTFIDSVLSTTPTAIITLTSRDGSENVVKTYKKPGFSKLYDKDGAAMEPADLDRAYASVNHGQDFVLIQYFVFDKVMRKLDYLLDKDKKKK
jgi:hypothetical protein